MRIAIAGLAHGHVNYVFSEIEHWPEARLVAVSESDPTLLAAYADKLGDAEIFDSLPELLGKHDVDAVAVTGIYADRASDAIAAMNAGADVLADKPLCTDLDQLSEIRSTVTATGRSLSVIFEKRHYGATIALRELIAAGELGDISLIATTGPHKLLYEARPEWFFERARYGGIVGDLASHDIDMTLWLTGAESGTIMASAGNSRLPQHPEFQDHFGLLMRAGRVSATMEAHWLSPEASPLHGHYRMRVTGSQGTAEVDWALNTLQVATHQSAPREIELGPRRRAAEYFFESLQNGIPLAISTADSLLATEVSLLGQLSADGNGVPLAWSRHSR